MIANYHTHTWRCNHAEGSEITYVENAIQRGLQILGFSDHTPYLFPEGYRSTFRMQPDQIDDYVKTILGLKKDFAKEIEIHLGVEAEYYPAYFDDTVSFLRDHGIEYMILGQHFVGNEPTGTYSGAHTDDVNLLKQYCSQTLNALQTGLYTYFAHPDLIHYIGNPKVYKEHMRHLLRETANCGLPLEINLLGVLETRHYPGKLFYELLAEENCPVILGCDAHRPEAMIDLQSEQNALEKVKEYQLNLINYVPIKKI